MASKNTIPAEQSSRIISHMNRDHQDSLVLYLEHYSGQSSYTAANAKLADVALDGVRISSGKGLSTSVPFTPALSSASELRGRLVAMDADCRKALGRDAITVKRYVPPTGIGAVFAAFAFWTLATGSVRSNFLPGSYLYDYAYKYVPAFAKLNYDLQPYVFWTIVVLHGLEAAFILRPKLRKHNVPLMTGVWWAWIASDFFLDGFGTLLRFDALVKKEKQAAEAKQH